MLHSPELRASTHVVLNQALNSAGNFLLTVWLINRLGLNEFGAFSLYFIVAQSIMTVIGALVAAPAVSIAGTTDPRTGRHMLSSAGLLAAGCLIAVLPLVLIGSTLISRWTQLEVSVAGLYGLIVVMTSADFIRRFLIFVDKRAGLWIFDVGRYSLLAAALAVEAAWSVNATSVAFMTIIWASNGIMIMFLLLMWAERILSVLPPKGFANHTLRLIRVGSWLAISSVMKVISDNILILIGAALLGSGAVGILRACDSVVGLINPLMLAVENIIPRWLGRRIREIGYLDAIESYKKTGGTIVVFFAMLLGTIALFAEPLFTLIAGASAAPYVWVMQITCAAYLAGVVYNMTVFAFRACERTLPVAESLAVSVVVTLFISWPIVQVFGLGGLAAGYLIVGLVRISVLILRVGSLRSDAEK